MGRVVSDIGHRNLVRAPAVLDRHAVDLPRTGPALGCPQDDHRPAGTPGVLALAGPALDLLDLVQCLVERCREAFVHMLGRFSVEAAGNDERSVAVALEERDELVLGNPREHRRIGDLVAVQVQDRQHGAVGGRIQELVRVPARRQRPGLGLAVADDARDEQVRVVEGGAVGVRERVPELASLVDRARRLRSDVARDSTGKGELAEELPQPVETEAHVRVDL